MRLLRGPGKYAPYLPGSFFLTSMDYYSPQVLFSTMYDMLGNGFSCQEMYGVDSPFKLLTARSALNAVIDVRLLDKRGRKLAALMCYVAEDSESKAELRCRLRRLGKRFRLQYQRPRPFTFR